MNLDRTKHKSTIEVKKKIYQNLNMSQEIILNLHALAVIQSRIFYILEGSEIKTLFDNTS